MINIEQNFSIFLIKKDDLFQENSEKNIEIFNLEKSKEWTKNEILMKFMGNVSIVYKESEEEFFVVICKNQTCSEKLKDLIQINEYIKNNL